MGEWGHASAVEVGPSAVVFAGPQRWLFLLPPLPRPVILTARHGKSVMPVDGNDAGPGLKGWVFACLAVRRNLADQQRAGAHGLFNVEAKTLGGAPQHDALGERLRLVEHALV